MARAITRRFRSPPNDAPTSNKMVDNYVRTLHACFHLVIVIVLLYLSHGRPQNNSLKPQFNHRLRKKQRELRNTNLPISFPKHRPPTRSYNEH
eukprot:766668-Amphidinium_carterae.1